MSRTEAVWGEVSVSSSRYFGPLPASTAGDAPRDHFSGNRGRAVPPVDEGFCRLDGTPSYELLKAGGVTAILYTGSSHKVRCLGAGLSPGDFVSSANGTSNFAVAMNSASSLLLDLREDPSLGRREGLDIGSGDASKRTLFDICNRGIEERDRASAANGSLDSCHRSREPPPL